MDSNDKADNHNDKMNDGSSGAQPGANKSNVNQQDSDNNKEEVNQQNEWTREYRWRWTHLFFHLWKNIFPRLNVWYNLVDKGKD